ncbi:hypothetical protein, partial [Sutterella parvirubra]|uniref:hypothetical protein n=1 Tax=Sutterella parvirubra TaxID=437898 RepID=UPI001C1213CE
AAMMRRVFFMVGPPFGASEDWASTRVPCFVGLTLAPGEWTRIRLRKALFTLPQDRFFRNFPQ